VGSDSRGSSSGSDGGGKAKSGDSNKDEIVHFSWQKGTLLDSRYRVLRLLGDGTFGRVLLAEDLNDRDRREVAVKVIRDVKRYAENAKIESDILKDIRRVDPNGGSTRSAIMLDNFSHNKHYCMVFQPCGASLYDFLKGNNYRGFWMQDIQSFATQSLEALSFLHSRLRLTHTDLKPENILLEAMGSPRPTEFPREAAWQKANRRSSSRNRGSSEYLRPVSSRIRLIDFGNATYKDEHHSSIINTRQYRGPEVILSLGWNELSDVWSMGCILMELYTGELLFGTHENLEHMALMENTLDMALPPYMLESAPRSVREKYVAGSSGQRRLAWPDNASSSSSERHVRAQKTLFHLVEENHGSFASLVQHLLTMDPKKRPSCKEALRHRFFDKRFSD
jgi:dual-specificity kinase